MEVSVRNPEVTRAQLRVLIVEDSPEFGAVLTDFLVQLGNVEVVGVTATAEQGLIDAACLMPDVVLMDLALPGLSGPEAIRQMKRWPFPPRTVLLSAWSPEALAHASRAAGADACVEKRSIASELSRAMGLTTAA
jgi:DNA-binding NarL/FixJ family response regulator